LQPQNNKEMDNNSNKPAGVSSKVYIGIIAFMGVIILWLMFDKYQQGVEAQIIITKLENSTNQKDSVEKELKGLMVQYEDMKTSNVKINAQLTAEQDKIQKLIQELKTIKSSNYSKIEEYKQQVGTLRAILRSYIVQVDSLNTTNKKLMAENQEVKENIQEVQNQNQQLSKKSDSLSNTVAIASVIKGLNIVVTGLNQRGTETNRRNKLAKFQVCLTLGENAIATKGNKDVILRIAGPDGKILTNTTSGFFRYKSQDIAFSSKRETSYEGKNSDICVYYNVPVELPEGRYMIDIFVDGNQIGTSSFSLK